MTSEGRGRIFDFSRVQPELLIDSAESSSKDTANHIDQMSRDQTERYQRKEIVETSGMVISSDHRQESGLHRTSGQFVTTPSNLNEPEDVLKTPHALSGGFTVGAGDFQSGERSSRSKSSHRSRASWTRRNQNKRRISSADHGEAHVDREDGTGKRKADEEGEVSSKMSRHNKGLMVHLKPSNPQ